MNEELFEDVIEFMESLEEEADQLTVIYKDDNGDETTAHLDIINKE